MDAPFKKGTIVEQVVPKPFVGTVVDVVWLPDEGCFHYHVDQDGVGDTNDARWFKTGEVRQMPAAEGEKA
jgi:hypothetical protein